MSTKPVSEHAALRADELVRINVDIPRAVATALGAVPGLEELRRRIIEELPRHPMKALDQLDLYALGARRAQ